MKVLSRWLLPLALLLQLAVAGDIEIVSREAWDARPPRADISTWEEYELPTPPYKRIVMHVTSMGRGIGPGEVRRIQDFHMDERGFSDIGYNYLIDSAGTVFEGRRLTFVPAHAGRTVEGDERHDITLDPDFGSMGIVFSAETDERLTAQQVRSAIALIGWLRTRHPVETVITHTEVKQGLLSRGLTPRHDYDAHTCPGAGSVEDVISIRSVVDRAFEPDAYRAFFGLNRGALSAPDSQ